MCKRDRDVIFRQMVEIRRLRAALGDVAKLTDVNADEAMAIANRALSDDPANHGTACQSN